MQAVEPSRRIEEIMVVVLQWPEGVSSWTRWPWGERPRRRVILVLAPASSIKTNRPLSQSPWADFHHSRLALTSSRSCSLACSVFFIGQVHLPQNVVNGGKRALERQGFAHFLQRDVGLAFNEAIQLAAMGRGKEPFTTGKAVAWGDVAGSLTLNQQLFHHAEGDAVPVGNFLPIAQAFVVTVQNALPQIHGEGLHGPPSYLIHKTDTLLF